MSQPDTQRLQAINSQLIKLYLQLEQADIEEKQIRSEISRLEAERDSLPHTAVYSHRAQQYVTILRSAASSLQLQRQSLQPFSGKLNDKLQPDEIRQKNILINKLKTSEKKIATYSQKLTEIGLLPFEIDDIILDGYREQNQRYLQQLLRSLEATLEDYLREHYDEHGSIPEDFFALMASWENEDNRRLLPSTPLRILELKRECQRKGIPSDDINRMIQSIASWTDDKKQAQLDQLKSKLLQEAKTLRKDEDVAIKVTEWITAHIQNKRLSPDQTAIVKLILDMQMYGVPQDKINAVIAFKQQQDSGLLSSLKNRFRRHS